MDKNLTLTFSTPSSDTVFTELSLDGNYNSRIYGDDKYVFEQKDVVYLKILPSFDVLPYDLKSSYGTFLRQAKGVFYTVVEYVNFLNGAEGNLKYNPEGGVTYSWVGNSLGTPLFSGKKVTVSGKGVGLLKCTYTTKGDRLKLANAGLDTEEDYKVLCLAAYANESDNASLSVDFSGTGAIYAKVKVVVKNICDDSVIQGAAVDITGIESGVTDENGAFVTTKEGLIGQTYSIRVTADGFVNSDIDFLRNDKFILSDPTG